MRQERYRKYGLVGQAMSRLREACPSTALGRARDAATISCNLCIFDAHLALADGPCRALRGCALSCMCSYYRRVLALQPSACVVWSVPGHRLRICPHRDEHSPNSRFSHLPSSTKAPCCSTIPVHGQAGCAAGNIHVHAVLCDGFTYVHACVR